MKIKSLLITITIWGTFLPGAEPEFPGFFRDFQAMGKQAWEQKSDHIGEIALFSLASGALVYKYDTMIRDQFVNTEKQAFNSRYLQSLTLPAHWYGKSTKNLLITYSGITAGYYLMGTLQGRDKPIETSYLLAESFFFTAGIVQTWKFILGRARPFNNQGNKTFDFFSLEDKNHSMPSGHTAIAFTLANTLAKAAGKPMIQIPCYLFAVSAGLQRISSDVHWTSDVLLGGLIGYAVSEFLYDNYYDEYETNLSAVNLNISIPLP